MVSLMHWDTPAAGNCPQKTGYGTFVKATMTFTLLTSLTGLSQGNILILFIDLYLFFRQLIAKGNKLWNHMNTFLNLKIKLSVAL